MGLGVKQSEGRGVGQECFFTGREDRNEER